MRFDTEHIAPVSDAEQKFSCVDTEKYYTEEITDDEKIDLVAAQILERYRAAFIELAK